MAGGRPQGRVLIAAGSDSSGGAGIQADIKTVTALGGYAATAVTAITVQNTLGVSDIHDVPADIVERQMRAVIEDIGLDAFKTGMLQNREIIEAVERVLEDLDVPLVIDPVMVATSGDALTNEDTKQSLISLLFPRAALVTPNVEEAETLAGMEVYSLDDMRHAAGALRDFGAAAALITGGELDKGRITDLLLTDEGEQLFEADRLDTPPYPRHRLHACFGHRHRPRPGLPAQRRRRPRSQLCPGRHPRRARLRPGPGPARPYSRDSAL